MAPLSSEGVGEESIPELTRLGEQLTRARQGAGLSVDALAERLRMEPRLLEALEQGDHRKLPEGVFIVATARRIAASLNVNVEEAIANVRQSRLMEHHAAGRSPSSKEAIPDLPQRPPQAPRKPHRQKSSHPGRRPIPPWVWPLAALLTALGAAATWLLLAQPPSQSPSPLPSSKLDPVTPALKKAPPKPPAAKPTQGTPPPGVSGIAPGEDTLRLQASEPSWLEVRDANGKTLFEGTLSGEKSFPLGRGLEVMAGRPYAVRASIGSAQANPLGGVDDIRWKRFSPQTLSPAASPAPTP